MNLTTTMKINELVNLRTNEKKDCKVSTNGIIWLRKGQYSSRVKENSHKKQKEDKPQKSANELLTDMVQSLQKFEPNYTKATQIHDGYFERKNEAEKKVRSKLYSINKRKVRARLTNFLNTDFGDKVMYFYTISFPKNTGEKIATSLLNSVLTSLRTQYNIKHYLWVKEYQKNGTIHFHLSLFHFVKVRIVNDLVKKYIKHAIRKELINWTIIGANNYNGVDISKDRNTRIPTNFAIGNKGKKIAGYITKYISKCSGNFTSKAWSCSNTVASVADGICCSIDEVVMMYGSDVVCDRAVYENEWCYFFRWMKEVPPDILDTLRQINNKRIVALN